MSKTSAHITLVVDRSGSMRITKAEAEGGIRQFLDEQRKLEDVKVRVSLYQFDTEYGSVWVSKKLNEIPEYSLEPRGYTALYDAIGKAIEDTRKTVGDLPEDKRPDKIVLVVVTDGMENSSREHTMDSITKLVEDAKKDGWEVIFLAGTLEAASMSRAAGMNTTGYDPRLRGSTRTVYGATGRSVSSYLAGETRTVETPDHVDPADSTKPVNRTQVKDPKASPDPSGSSQK